MVNINYGNNKEILSVCKPLEEYAWFVAQVRKNLVDNRDGKSVEIGDAIDQAIDEMPNDFEIKNS